jgi:hypothetical protein
MAEMLLGGQRVLPRATGGGISISVSELGPALRDI